MYIYMYIVYIYAYMDVAYLQDAYDMTIKNYEMAGIVFFFHITHSNPFMLKYSQIYI